MLARVASIAACSHLAFLHKFTQGFCDPSHSLGIGSLAAAFHSNLAAGLSQSLYDTGTHGTGADYGYFLYCHNC